MDKIITDITILKQISKETTKAEVKELNLTERLKQANKTAWTKGCGLAAIQIGIPLRFAWYGIPGGKQGILLNPIIINKWGEEIKEEGCLSIPDTWINVSRAITIEYVSGGKKDKANGFLARLIQHEIDHMDGKIINVAIA